MDRERLHEFISKRTGNCRILVVGDVMVDKYYYGDVNRFSDEAPVPVARVVREKVFLGGAANVARNLALLGCETSITGFVGSDTNCESLLEHLAESGIEWHGLVYTDTPTITKVRIMSGHYQMFRVDFEDTSPRDQADTDKLRSYIVHRLNESLDALVIADFEKGVCTEHFCQQIIREAHAHGVPVIVNPYGRNWIKYAHADYVTPNVAKINKILLEPVQKKDDQQVEQAARYAMRKFKLKNILLTRSEDGITLVQDHHVTHIPTKVLELYDSTGVGDTVLAAFAMAIAGGLKPKAGAYLANLAAGIVIAKPGSYAVPKNELLELLA